MKRRETDQRNDLPGFSRRTFIGGLGSVAALSATTFSSLEALASCREEAIQNQASAGSAATCFPEEFAPSESPVHLVEQPYRKSICLNGAWQFQPVTLPDRFREGYDPAPVLPAAIPDRWEPTRVSIPSPWNVNSFANHHGEGGDFRCYPDYPESWEKVEMAWLRKEFFIPADWEGKHLSLHFEAVAGKVEVLINGKAAGSHFDNFLPFEADITNFAVCGGNNEVLVGVRKASLFDKKGPYGRRSYQGGSFWGQHIAGIWQDVHVIATPMVRVSDVYLQPKVDVDVLQADVRCHNDLDHEVEITVSAEVFAVRSKTRRTEITAPLPDSDLDPNAVLTMPPVRLRVPAHGTETVTLQQTVRQSLRVWNEAHPHLYGIVAKIHSDSGIADVRHARFGWRQITFRGSEVLLNGKPLLLRGDSWHFMGIPQMTRRYAWAWFTALREAGLNAVRLHAQPYPSFYLDVADEMGILVLDETAIWASDGGPKVDDPAFWVDTERHLAALIRRDRNHPCVFGWSVSNEMLPVITNVMRNPPGAKEELLRHYDIWASICRTLDPSRPWISADGDEDGEGRLPVYIVHYGGPEAMQRGEASGKPWGVGEAGDAYYATPPQVAETNGERAYESFEGRMEGVAISSYQSLIGQRAHRAIYRSIFNLVWYGFKPLPLGMKCLSRPPALEDGIFFPPPVEGKPGVQPRRLGPYCTTLNPGYDPTLPLYESWPLCEAIRDASAEPPVAGRWSRPPKPPTQQAPPSVSPVTSVRVMGADGSTLASRLQKIGVPKAFMTSQNAPQILFIDGARPPSGNTRKIIHGVLERGGTVFVWGADVQTVAALNALLPAPVRITCRSTSSLLPITPSPITYGLKPDKLYFCDEQSPEIVPMGLDGALIRQSSVLLSDCNTDWLKWNNQPEYAKTAMVIRSEREKKPSGVVLAQKQAGRGRFLITVLSSTPQTVREENISRAILSNLGISLSAGMDSGKPLLRSGVLARALACGYFPEQDAAAQLNIVSGNGKLFRADSMAAGMKWRLITNEDGDFDFRKMQLSGSPQNGSVYLSFWVESPRSLEDLLLQPNLPSVALEVALRGTATVWVNGQKILGNADPSGAIMTADALRLRAGWNHFLFRIRMMPGQHNFQARFTSNHPDFLSQLDSALESP